MLMKKSFCKLCDVELISLLTCGSAKLNVLLHKKRQANVDNWWNIFFRHLAEEIRLEYSERSDGKTEDLIKLASDIIPYDMKHNAEIDACDLSMEIERLDLLERYVDESTFQRVCLYLVR